jgi:hypothetical protein
VEGHAGQDVTGATLMLDDGQVIKATIENGWFTAWWPGTHDATDAIVTTASGTTSEHLATAGPPRCPAGASCNAVGYSPAQAGGPGTSYSYGAVQGGASGGGESYSKRR